MSDLPIRRSDEGLPFSNGGCYFGCHSKVSCKSVLTESVDDVTITYWIRATEPLKNEGNIPNLMSPLSVRRMFAPWKEKKKPHKLISLTWTWTGILSIFDWTICVKQSICTGIHLKALHCVLWIFAAHLADLTSPFPRDHVTTREQLC